MQRLQFSLIALSAIALAVFSYSAMGQEPPDGPPPQDGAGPGGPQDDGGGPGGPGGPAGPRAPRGPVAGFHILPPFAADSLKLTAEQKKQIAELEKETKAKLYKILTAEQKKILEQARPPRPGQGGPRQGFGRRGQGGQGGGPNDGPGGPDDAPPPRPADDQSF